MKALVISNYNSTVSVRPEAEIFIGLKKLGVDVEVMTYGDSDYAEKFRQQGIRVINHHPEKRMDRKSVQVIRDTLVKGKHDILHLFNGKAIINGIQAAKNIPVKVVLYRGYTGNIHWYDPTAYFKFLHPRVDKIVCNSAGVEAHLQRQLFFDKSKTITILKGHSPDWYNEVTPIDREALQIPTDAFVATIVANDRKMKGIPYLLKATYEIPVDLPVYFLLVGQGLDNKKNLLLADRSPNREKIHFLGFRHDALSIVAASDVFVLSSIKGESITKSVLEAMSLGIAPVITDIPGNKELVIHEVNGLVVPASNSPALAQGILKAFQNPELRKQWGQKSKERIETHLNIKDTISNMLNFYKSLLGKD